MDILGNREPHAKTRGPRLRRAIRLAPAAAVALLVSAFASPAHANHVASATYTGTAASGGTIEFDVSPDGGSVTRFAVNDVPTTCGTVSSQVTGSIPIVNHSFSQTSGALRFNGSFPSPQQAQGDLTVQVYGFPSCTSDPVAWNASTPTPPPPPPSAAPAPAPGASGYASCVRRANRAFRSQRKAAQRAKAKAKSKAAKTKAKRRLKQAIRKRKRAVRACAALR